MRQRTILATAAAFAVALSTPGLAKPGNGGGGGPEGAGAGNRGGPANGGSIGGMGDSMRDFGRANSRALEQANTRAIERANENSVLKGGTEATSSTRLRTGSRIPESSSSGMQIIGVTEGMTVVDSSGATVGTVTDVNTRGNDTVRNVKVTLADGSTVVLRSKDLTVNGGVLTTTTVEGQAANRRVDSQGAANANVRALVRANERSALASAGVTTLAGLAAGLTVNNSGGTAIGTVSQVVTNRAGAVVGINVQLVGGGTVFVPATTLSLSGGTVVTSSTQF